MRVALGQLPISSVPQVNLDRVRAAAALAGTQGAQMIVFPEGTQARFSVDLRAVAEPLDGEFSLGLAAAAQSAGVAIVAGLFEPAPDGRVFNTTVAYEADGTLAAVYRKLHLFDALGHRESDSVAPGDDTVIATVAGLRVGFMTCYDVRFPELARRLAADGAQLLVLPAAWAAGPVKEDHWVTLVRARAIENTIWLAAAGQVPDPAEPATRARPRESAWARLTSATPSRCGRCCHPSRAAARTSPVAGQRPFPASRDLSLRARGRPRARRPRS